MSLRLDDAKSEVRLAALEALERLGEKEDLLAAVSARLEHADSEVRAAAVEVRTRMK